MEEGTVYFRDGNLITESGDAKVYRMNDEMFLEVGPGHNLVAKENDLIDYIWQISDKPYGDCLIIGLGLGISSGYILSVPNVKSLTTIEENPNVIEVQAEVNKIEDGRFKIIHGEVLPYLYKTKDRFDFVYLDCYSYIDEDTLPLIADIVAGAKRTLKPNGLVSGWLDSNTPEVFVEYFFKIFQ